MTTNTSEAGLEDLILRAMTGRTDALSPGHKATETAAPVAGGTGWLLGDAIHYDRDYAVDLVQLRGFLRATQEDLLEPLSLDTDGSTRRKFLARLQGEISKRGVIDVLRSGLKHGAHHIDLFYGTPSPGNTKAEERSASNRFSVSRQLRYSRDETRLALDLCCFINGLPVATFELKNSLTKQTVADAVEQYKRDRDPRELLFQLSRCTVHFAVDDHEVRFCTELRGKASWFLPFNKGWSDGAGNPPNPNGLKTNYLWKEILTPSGLTNILENYAQVVEEKDEKSGRKRRKQIFPATTSSTWCDVWAHEHGDTQGEGFRKHLDWAQPCQLLLPTSFRNLPGRPILGLEVDLPVPYGQLRQQIRFVLELARLEE
jgi:type I restriction enzyme R subunit